MDFKALKPKKALRLKRLEIISKIGQGTHGSVFKAKSKLSKKVVAVKKLRLAPGPKAKKKALKEVKSL